MNVIPASGRLGDLASLADVGLRMESAFGGMPTPLTVSATKLAADGSPAPLTHAETATVPVLTGSAESLPWTITAASMLLRRDVAELVPHCYSDDGRLDHPGWSRLCARSRDLLLACGELPDEPMRVPGAVADPELTSMSRFIIDSRLTFPVVLIDGPVPAGAALLADTADPGSTTHLLALQPGMSRLEAAVHERLGIRALLPWRTSLHDGSLAALALRAIDFATQRSRGQDNC